MDSNLTPDASSVVALTTAIAVTGVVLLVIYLGVSAALSRIFRTAGGSGWPAYIPVYNIIYYWKVGGLSYWWSLILLAPVLLYGYLLYQFGFSQATTFAQATNSLSPSSPEIPAGLESYAVAFLVINLIQLVISIYATAIIHNKIGVTQWWFVVWFFIPLLWVLILGVKSNPNQAVAVKPRDPRKAAAEADKVRIVGGPKLPPASESSKSFESAGYSTRYLKK